MLFSTEEVGSEVLNKFEPVSSINNLIVLCIKIDFLLLLEINKLLPVSFCTLSSCGKMHKK